MKPARGFRRVAMGTMLVICLAGAFGLAGAFEAAAVVAGVLFQESFDAGLRPEVWRPTALPELESGNLFEIVRVDGNAVLRVRAQASDSGLVTATAFDVAEFPFLSWRWRVDELPRGAGAKPAARADCPARIVVNFEKGSAYQREPYRIAYVWSSQQGKEDLFAAPQNAGYEKIIALRGGREGLGRWHSEQRNLWEDFERAFGREPTAVESVEIGAGAAKTDSRGIGFLDDLKISAGAS